MALRTVLSALAFPIILLPAAIWVMYKPIRLLAPERAATLRCIEAKLCLDDTSKSRLAAELYAEAFASVGNSVGAFRKPPRVVFCSTEECFQAFGFRSTAGTLGRWGIAIGPRGWSGYYVRHEMIHHRQSEELGWFRSWQAPKWFIEGMAYSLSGDPRRPLGGRWEKDRSEFERWYREVGTRDIWAEAKRIRLPPDP